MRKVTEKFFAAAGSCFAPEKIIYGKVKKQTMFISPGFTATKDSEDFYDKLREYAHSINKYVILMEK